MERGRKKNHPIISRQFFEKKGRKQTNLKGHLIEGRVSFVALQDIAVSYFGFSVFR